MNEAQTEYEYIDPALKAAGWGVVEGSQVRKQWPISQGRLLGQGRRSKPLKADYVLRYKNRSLAVIEAKARDIYYTSGVAQAKDYAERLNVRFTYATNGLKIYGIDMQMCLEGDISHFPSPDELWNLTFPVPVTTKEAENASWNERLFAVPFEDKSGTWQLRYYQDNAVTKVLEAVANGDTRILLTLATGTGKTAIAFQIAWKLFHSKWTVRQAHQPDFNPENARSPRILFLADRNILADQAFNSFNAFEEDALVRIKPDEIRKKGKVPKNGSIFFTIFQTFMSGGSASSPTANISSSPTQQEEEQIFLDEVEINNKANGFMYILQCNDGSFYTGSTNDLARRIEQHKNGEGANYTKLNAPVKLVYYEVFDRVDLAFEREKQVQKWSRAKKIALIKGDIELLKKLSKSKSEQEPKVGELVEPYFGEYPPDYFDFIVIDECHRGGANDESNWREIMDYFSPAVQLGLTATPKRTENIDTYKYFGEPVYIYSLKEGINDGFLTPFKVKRINTTLDDYIYTSDDTIIEGEIEEGRIYTETDFNRIIEIKAREEKRVKIFMNDINQKEKSIVFCATQEHAAAVRDLINQNKISKDPNYCVRVTANDGEIGDQFLREFQDNEKTIPTILTTSQKLSTGVDARNIRNIILMRPVKQMIEFKQILGRGTRLFDGKDYFTLYDFVNAYEQFSDREWGETIAACKECGKEACICINTLCEVCGQFPCECKPEVCDRCKQSPCVCENISQICKDCNQDPCVCPEKQCPECGKSPCVCKKNAMIKVKLDDGKEREIQHMVATSFWNADGKPLSAEEFLHSLFGALPALFKDEEELRRLWSSPLTRKSLLEKLDQAGFSKQDLTTLQELINAEKSDLFDVLEYVLNSDFKPISRELRAAIAQPKIFALLNNKQKEFIEFVLSKYIESGVEELEQAKLPILLTNKYQSLEDAKEVLGETASISSLFVSFQKYLYQEVVA